MPTIEEISAWSLDEIKGEIIELIPSGWTMTCSQHSEGYWLVKVYSLTNPEEVELEEAHVDQRIALLNVFGHFWMKTFPEVQKTSPWVRHRELNGDLVTDRVLFGVGTDVPDPEDLNPSEIESVYRIKK